MIKSNNPHLEGGEKRLHRSKNDEIRFGWTRTIQVQMKKQSKDVSSNIRAACTTPNTEIMLFFRIVPSDPVAPCSGSAERWWANCLAMG